VAPDRKNLEMKAAKFSNNLVSKVRNIYTLFYHREQETPIRNFVSMWHHEHGEAQHCGYQIPERQMKLKLNFKVLRGASE
jgi:hypothetical protein